MSKVESRNSDRIKQLNRSLVLKAIHKNGPITKADIASKMKLTFAAIGNITSELEENGIIKVAGYGESNGGRRPALYEMNWNDYFVIALDIGVTKISAAIVNLKADISHEETVFTGEEGCNAPLIETVYKTIDKLLEGPDLPMKNLLGIGVSAPGPIDDVAGKLLSPPNLQNTETVHIKELLEQRYQLMTVVEKDANAAALAEQWFGKTQIHENIMYIFADQGIGGGMIIDSRIFKGFQNSAGEIGHVSIDIDGPRCNCGNFGCLEAMASGIAIIRRVKEEIRRGTQSSLAELYLEQKKELTLEMIIDHGKKGDKLVQNILDETGRYFGIGLANAINFFAPSEIIFGGQIVDLYPEIIGIAERIAKSRAFSAFASKIELKKSSFGSQSSLIGAASIIQQSIFDQPEMMFL